MLVGVALAGLGRIEAADGITPEAAADFAWFSTLGFPDVRGCPVAHVDRGGPTHWMEQKMPESFEDDFLLRHGEDESFAVLTPELFTLEFKTSPATADQYRVGYETRPLAEAAEDYLRALEKKPNDREAVFRRGFGQQLTERAQIFVWAWACERTGLEEQAGRLYARAVAMPTLSARTEEPADFHGRLERDLGYVMIWRATLDFGNVTVPRPQLLAEFERIAKNYPDAEYADRARQTADELRRMVAEDAAHAAKTVESLDSLPPEERTAELIFRLRDQHGEQLSQPGSCNIFTEEETGEMLGKRNELTPAKQLVALGYAAVPPLIAALDDKAFSRSVGYWRNFTYSHYVLTVGDCAEQILDRIAGKQFFHGTTTSSYMGKDEQTKAVKAAVEAWWKTAQGKGERQTLIDTVSAGTEDGSRDARWLLKKYPDAGVGPLIEGAKRAEGWTRGQYVRAIGAVSGDEALAFLREEMREGPFLGARVFAAQAVARHGHGAEAVAAMIAAWKQLRPSLEGKAPEIDSRSPSDKEAFDWLVRFLAGSGSVEAVQALGHDLGECRVSVRLAVIRTFEPDVAKVDTETGEGAGAKGSGLGLDASEKVEDAVEALLAAELEDKPTLVKDREKTSGKEVGTGSVGEAAANVLTHRFPDR